MILSFMVHPARFFYSENQFEIMPYVLTAKIVTRLPKDSFYIVYWISTLDRNNSPIIF